MKELSIEEKAKAYDNALEIAKGLYAKDAPDNLHLERMFPVLKESEGERIRKELIEFVKSRGGFKQEYIAWLEKQGEQKSTANNFESALKHIMEEAIECGDTRNLKTDAEMLMRLVQKPSEWSETDKLKMETIINVISNQRGSAIFEGFLPEELINWLNSLKDRFVPQPKREWSEEDEKMFNTIGNSLDRGRVERVWHTTIREVVAWLKILKDRFTWKPSEEQMKALWDSIPENVKETSEREMLLDSLYQDLKKLTE